MYGYETLSFKVSEDRQHSYVLSIGSIVPKKYEVSGKLEKTQNDELLS
jgi:hypothetical protein